MYTYNTSTKKATVTDYTGSDTDVVIPKTTYSDQLYTVTTIAADAFRDNANVEYFSIPNTITSLGSSAFRACTSLKGITIPSSVSTISNYLCYGCTSLEYVDIEDGITKIGQQAFENCSSLTSVEIPESVTSFGGVAVFRGCTKLQSVNILFIDKCHYWKWCYWY